METAAKRIIVRVELWHGLFLLILLLTLGQAQIIDPTALLAGGLFMGLNFFLLSFGVAWVLMPLAGKGRVRAGVTVLVLKILIFLALLITLFYRFDFDPISFSVGFSTLILAIFFETIRKSLQAER
jgi:hypothetical protein